jgi:acetyl esterase
MSYPFDPELAAAVPLLPDLPVSDLAAARAVEGQLLAAVRTPDLSGVDVSDVAVPGAPGAPDVRMRVYRPEGVTEPVGAVFDIHGGGFVMGSIELVHPRNVQLCRGLGAVVVSVDYRLAPEHPFPAALEDCYAGLTWLAKHAGELGIDPDRIAVHGVSAGGGLAAALALLTRDRRGPALCFQYLSVPELDDRLESESMREFTDTPIWGRANAVLSWEAYLGDGVPGTPDVSPYAAPARATDLEGLPPAYVSAMQFDPLRDEGIAYALDLLAAGVTVEMHLFPGTFHGSALLVRSEISRRELDEEIAVLRRALLT